MQLRAKLNDHHDTVRPVVVLGGIPAHTDVPGQLGRIRHRGLIRERSQPAGVAKQRGCIEPRPADPIGVGDLALVEQVRPGAAQYERLRAAGSDKVHKVMGGQVAVSLRCLTETEVQFGLARPAPVDRGLARVRPGGYLPLGDRHRERIEAAQDERIPAGRLACGRDLREPAQ